MKLDTYEKLKKDSIKNTKRMIEFINCFDGYGLVITDQDLVEERVKELNHKENDGH